jgi:hypothetical protein
VVPGIRGLSARPKETRTPRAREALLRSDEKCSPIVPHRHAFATPRTSTKTCHLQAIRKRVSNGFEPTTAWTTSRHQIVRARKSCTHSAGPSRSDQLDRAWLTEMPRHWPCPSARSSHSGLDWRTCFVVAAVLSVNVDDASQSVPKQVCGEPRSRPRRPLHRRNCKSGGERPLPRVRTPKNAHGSDRLAGSGAARRRSRCMQLF